MAQHDYVIDNSTGANVRADINNALLAISSTNSGSSAPSTTYAFQLFANTTTSKLQIRNAANSAFVDLIGLDGSILLPDGSVSSPSLAFSDDLNTGIFSSAADTLNFTTGGVERLELGAATVFNEDGADVDFRIEGDTEANLFYVDAGNDRIGIGTSSPSALLSLKGSQNSTLLHLNDSSEAGHRQFTITSSSNGLIYTLNSQGSSGGVSGEMAFATQGSERMRIASSGKVGLGTSSPSSLLHLRQEHNAGTTGIGIFQIENTRANTGSGAAAITFRTNEITSGFSGIRAQIAAEYDGANNVSGRLVFLTVNSSGAFQEVIRLDDFGNVGIGSSSPTEKLEINLGTDKIVQFTGGIGQIGNVAGLFAVNTAKTEIADFGIMGNTLKFASGTAASGAERMRIRSDGNVTIGKTANFGAGNHAGIELHAVNHYGMFVRSGGEAIFVGRNGNTGLVVNILYNGNAIGSISTDGANAAFNTSSDYRLKENASAISDGITRLKNLKPYRFNFKSDTSKVVDGFFAHEVTPVVPEAVTGTKDELALEDDEKTNVKKGDPIYQGIDQSKLVPLLVAAVQELIGKVEALEAA